MAKFITKYGREVEVTHRMKDGSVRDTMVGFKLTPENAPPLFVRVVNDMLDNYRRKLAEENALKDKQDSEK